MMNRIFINDTYLNNYHTIKSQTYTFYYLTQSSDKNIDIFEFSNKVNSLIK